jgi:integral membrane protein 2B
MTIITKTITEKKLDKQQQPLVENEILESLPPPKEGEEATHVYMTFPTRGARRVSTATTICVFLTALLVLTVGVIGGVYLYKQFSQVKMHKYRALCNVPYEDLEYRASAMQGVAIASKEDNSQEDSYEDSSEDMINTKSYFQEEFEIDLDYQVYEQIDVPDFRGGRRGRFIHDFSANKTGIIDLDGRRCFVMPLNRSNVLPPQSLFDLVLKMKAGYYEVDTGVVRETMRVVRPRITNYDSVGYYIARECTSLPTYRLQRITSPVFRRSIEDKKYLFTEFAGKHIVQLQIVNWFDTGDAASDN